MYYLKDDLGRIVMADESPIEGALQTDRKIVAGFDGFCYFIEDTETDEYKQRKEEYEKIQAADNELPVLLDWFSEYDVQVAQYNRHVRTQSNEVEEYHIQGVTYHSIEEMDTAAINQANRIKEIRILLNREN